ARSTGGPFFTNPTDKGKSVWLRTITSNRPDDSHPIATHATSSRRTHRMNPSVRTLQPMSMSPLPSRHTGNYQLPTTNYQLPTHYTVIPLSSSACCWAFIASHAPSVSIASRACEPL